MMAKLWSLASWIFVYGNLLLAWPVVDAVFSSPFDPNFACCGGCSSSQRGDAYNNKLTNGARVFIWDTKLKINPAPVCLLTFPYDKALNEQEGDRRVRSGRLVGTSYPIDHDLDALCCEQRGLCQLLEEDASGKCQCVKKWGFTGDHCEHSVYDTATKNNTTLFPPRVDLSNVVRLLPDLRGYLVDFDIESALLSSHDAAATTSTRLLSVFQLEEQISYRQYAWSTSACVVLGAVFFVMVFLLQFMWSFCCVKCGCRKKDPRKQPRIYSKATKICWGMLMVSFLSLGAAAAVVAFLTAHTKLVPGRDAIGDLLATNLPTDVAQFESALATPLDHVLLAVGSPNAETLTALQGRARETMRPLKFLDPQSTSNDILALPVFTILGELQPYSTLYPTVNTLSIDCAKLNITPNVAVRMSIGATSGCFRCRTCATLSSLVDDARARWRRRAYKAQLDLRDSREQLLAFGSTQDTLWPSIREFRRRLDSSTSAFMTRSQEVAAQYEQLSTEAMQLTVFGLIVLMGLSGLALLLSLMAVIVGIKTNKRLITRTTCFVAEIACVVALILTGVIYSSVMMAHDGITVLQLFDRNVSVLIDSRSSLANDTTLWLWDHSFVDATRMNETLAFADTLRVPPHPTPTDDTPPRLDIRDLYNLPVLFELETLLRDMGVARASLFEWEESFLAMQHQWLLVWAFGNDSVVSPYTATIHQSLLKSSIAKLLDPDDDKKLVTDGDFAFIQRVFNESWRGVDDRGVAQNELIVSQWLFVARLEQQKQRLDQYCTKVADVIAKTRPLLNDLIAKTSELEAAEFELKASVEFFTEKLRSAKLGDCSFDGNCAWLRDSLNRAFAEFQELLTNAEFAAVCCGVSFVALLLGLVCAGCFASRLRRNIVKVYVAS